MLIYQRVSSILMGWQRVLNTIEHFSSCGLQVQFHGCSPCFLDLLLICGSWNHWNTIRYSKNGLHLLVFFAHYHGISWDSFPECMARQPEASADHVDATLGTEHLARVHREQGPSAARWVPDGSPFLRLFCVAIWLSLLILFCGIYLVYIYIL